MNASRTTLGAALWLGLAAAMALYATCAVYVRVAPPWLDSLGDAVGEVLMREGMRLETAGAWENAEARYVQALAASFAGDFNRLHTEKLLGALLWRQGRYVDAEPHLRAAVNSPTPSLGAFEPLVDVLFQLERLDEASTLTETWRAQAEDRGDKTAQAAALFHAGRIALRQEEPDRAIPLYEASLALDAASTSASDLGILYAQRGEPEKAMAYLDQYLAQGGSGSRATYARELRSRLAQELAAQTEAP
jgi:tetratricopeptide (TPR) repeat protein